jgi:hypothetical protein
MGSGIILRANRPNLKSQASMTFVCLFSTLLGCSKIVSGGPDSQGLKSGEQLGSAIESAITAIGATPDEAEGESFAAPLSQKIKQLAACTGRAGDEPCNSGVRTVLYSSCTLPGSDRTLRGDVTLEYSEPTCAVSASGQSVTRKAYTVRQGTDSDIQVSWYPTSAYTGETVGGGTKVTRGSGTNYTLEILGINKRLESGHQISLKSTQPSTLSTAAGLLERNGRVITGGDLKLTHNTLRYTVEFAPLNWTYNASCCYPVSGEATLRYSGTVSGQGSVKFTGCGTARLIAAGQTADLIFQTCE